MGGFRACEGDESHHLRNGKDLVIVAMWNFGFQTLCIVREVLDRKLSGFPINAPKPFRKSTAPNPPGSLGLPRLVAIALHGGLVPGQRLDWDPQRRLAQRAGKGIACSPWPIRPQTTDGSPPSPPAYLGDPRKVRKDPWGKVWIVTTASGGSSSETLPILKLPASRQDCASWAGAPHQLQ